MPGHLITSQWIQVLVPVKSPSPRHSTASFLNFVQHETLFETMKELLDYRGSSMDFVSALALIYLSFVCLLNNDIFSEFLLHALLCTTL